MRPAKALALAAKVRSGRGYLSSESKPDFCTAVATSHNGFAALASLQLWLLIANMHDGQAKRGGAAATASASEDAAASTGAGACNANIGGADFALALDKAVACEDCSERSSNNRFSSSDKLSKCMAPCCPCLAFAWIPRTAAQPLVAQPVPPQEEIGILYYALRSTSTL